MAAEVTPHGFTTSAEDSAYQTLVKNFQSHLKGSSYVRGPWREEYPIGTTSAVISKFTEDLVARGFRQFEDLTTSEGKHYTKIGLLDITEVAPEDPLTDNPSADAEPIDDGSTTTPPLWDPKFTANSVYHYNLKIAKKVQDDFRRIIHEPNSSDCDKEEAKKMLIDNYMKMHGY